MPNKKVLVTGSSSFTGRYILSELKSNGFSLVEHKSQFLDLRNYEDVLNFVKKSQPNYVIHLAALSFVGHDNVNEIYETNLLGTINLLRALGEAQLELYKVILASSANIYGSIEGSIKEDSAPRPVNHYGISKLSMELAANQWLDKLPLVISRPFNYTGVGQADHFLVPKIVKHFKRQDKRIELGNVDVYRDFSDVRDIARWYVKLLDSPIINKTINFCSGELVSLRNIIDILNSFAGYEIDIQVNPRFVRDNEIVKLCGNDELLRNSIDIGQRYKIKDTLSWMYYS